MSVYTEFTEFTRKEIKDFETKFTLWVYRRGWWLWSHINFVRYITMYCLVMFSYELVGDELNELDWWKGGGRMVTWSVVNCPSRWSLYVSLALSVDQLSQSQNPKYASEVRVRMIWLSERRRHSLGSARCVTWLCDSAWCTTTLVPRANFFEPFKLFL